MHYGSVSKPAWSRGSLNGESGSTRWTRLRPRLDSLIDHVGYLAITTSAMRRAAQLWAEARRRGQPTASDSALDGDVILAAQASTLNGDEVIIATTNTKHLERFVPARLWTDIN